MLHFIVNKLYSRNVVKLSHYRLHLSNSGIKHNKQISLAPRLKNIQMHTQVPMHATVIIDQINFVKISSAFSLILIYANLIFCFNRNAIKGIWLLQASYNAVLSNFDNEIMSESI